MVQFTRTVRRGNTESRGINEQSYVFFIKSL